MFKRRLKYNLIKFLRLKGAPVKIALGFAVGAVINFYPTFGFGVPLAGLTAAAFFSSIPAGILGDLIFKPFFPLFFYLNLVTGFWLWSGKTYSIFYIKKILRHHHLAEIGSLGKVFFFGAIINSLILGTILYTFVYFVVERYRLVILKWLVRRNGRK